MMMNNYLTKKETEYLNANQSKIYERVYKKIALSNYKSLCLSEQVCPKCGMDLDCDDFCRKCGIMYSFLSEDLFLD